MNKNMILESMYEVIKESTKWHLDSEDKVYCHFIDGVVSVTKKMLEKCEIMELEAKTSVLKSATTYLEQGHKSAYTTMA